MVAGMSMTKDNFVRGVNLISKYTGESPAVGNDILWFGSYDDVPDDVRIELESLGWFISEDSWACYL